MRIVTHDGKEGKKGNAGKRAKGLPFGLGPGVPREVRDAWASLLDGAEEYVLRRPGRGFDLTARPPRAEGLGVPSRAGRGLGLKVITGRGGVVGEKPEREAQGQAARVRLEPAMLKVSGAVVELRGPRVRKDGRRKAKARQKRGVIREFSTAARRRLYRRIMSVPWGEKVRVARRRGSRAGGEVFVVGLTWPGREELVPRSGPEVQRALDMLERRFRRLFGERGFAAVWKREFQRRGAPEVIMLLRVVEVPARWRGRWPGLEVTDEGFLVLLRQWVGRVWHEICGCGDADHAKAGTSVDRAYGTGERLARYFAKYVTRKGRKEYQNEVPEGFENPGRFWGVWNPEVWEIEVTELELVGSVFYQVRRLMVRYARRKWRKWSWGLQRWERWKGLTVYGTVFGRQLVGWVTAGG